jgi:hypothetical protein
MAIMNLKKGDKVRLTNHAANIIGRRDLLGKELVVSEMFHDKSEISYARVDGIDFDFFIEEGDTELERI